LVASPSKNRTDFCFFEVQGETEHAVRELDHLVQHHVAQTLNARNAIAVSRTIPTLLFVVDVFSPAIFVSISSSMVLMDSNCLGFREADSFPTNSSSC